MSDREAKRKAVKINENNEILESVQAFSCVAISPLTFRVNFFCSSLEVVIHDGLV